MKLQLDVTLTKIAPVASCAQGFENQVRCFGVHFGLQFPTVLVEKQNVLPRAFIELMTAAELHSFATSGGAIHGPKKGLPYRLTQIFTGQCMLKSLSSSRTLNASQQSVAQRERKA